MAPSTRRQQEIDQIRHRILDALRDTMDSEKATIQHVREVNRRGWTIEIRYHGQTYMGDDNYSLVEGIVLDDAELDQAIAWARAEWDAEIERYAGGQAR